MGRQITAEERNLRVSDGCNMTRFLPAVDSPVLTIPLMGQAAVFAKN